MSKLSSQSGSALVYVFVGIALFGALMFVYSRGGSQNSNSLTTQQAKAKAIEIIDRADLIVSSVDKLMANGCSINQLNFYSAHYTQVGTANPSAPVDESCNIYSPKGGKLTWQGCPDPTLCSDPYLYAPQIPRSLVVNSVGNYPEDLVYLVLVRKEVCLAINSMLGLPTTNLPGAGVDGGPYIGTFSKDNGFPSLPSSSNSLPFIGKTAGCLYRTNYMSLWGGEFFMYYRVLVAL